MDDEARAAVKAIWNYPGVRFKEYDWATDPAYIEMEDRLNIMFPTPEVKEWALTLVGKYFAEKDE